MKEEIIKILAKHGLDDKTIMDIINDLGGVIKELINTNGDDNIEKVIADFDATTDEDFI